MSVWHRECSEQNRASQEALMSEAAQRRVEWELAFEIPIR